MYIATQSFFANSGRFFEKGDKISKLWYFFLPKRDKIMFEKDVDFISKTTISKSETVKTSREVGNYTPRQVQTRKDDVYIPPTSYKHPSNSHYGYGPEPGYSYNHGSQYVYPSDQYIQTDDTPSHSHSHGDSHSHSSDYGHSHSDSSSYDSGSYSSSDSSSCDSGGGDCGGGGGCD